jgi:hypothetical protein
MRFQTLAAAAALTVGFAFSHAASAAILIQAGNVPGNLATVHLDGTDDGSDEIVNGSVNGGGALGDVGVVITGLEDITVSANGGGQGQAWVVSTDGLFRSLDFRLASGFTFGALEFDLNAPNAKGPPPKWDVNISGFGINGEFKTVLLEDITNNSFINVWTSGFSRLEHVTFSMADGSPDLIGVGHIRVGDVAAVVPEPATWAMMIMGFGGVGALMRRRRLAVA